MKRTMLIFLMAVITTPLLAQDAVKKASPVKLLIRAALELGGDEIAEVYFTDGNTQSVKAGQGGSLGVGMQLAFAQEKLLIHTSAGIKYVTTSADNAHIRLTRIPVHLTAHYMVAPKLRIGGGVVTHRGIKFNADGIGDDLKFNGATGPMFEIAYSGVGLSYTAMKYTDEENNSYKANAIGLSFTLTVPNKK